MNEKSISLDYRLQATYQIDPPAALKQRLLEIPETAPQELKRQRARAGLVKFLSSPLTDSTWRFAFPAIAAIAVVIVLMMGDLQPVSEHATTDETIATQAAQEKAIREFIIVMSYLQRSTARAHAAVQYELGAGLMAAFDGGEESFRDSSDRVTNGG